MTTSIARPIPPAAIAVNDAPVAPLHPAAPPRSHMFREELSYSALLIAHRITNNQQIYRTNKRKTWVLRTLGTLGIGGNMPDTTTASAVLLSPT